MISASFPATFSSNEDEVATEGTAFALGVGILEVGHWYFSFAGELEEPKFCTVFGLAGLFSRLGFFRRRGFVGRAVVGLPLAGSCWGGGSDA